MKKVLLIGGTGAIGKYVAPILINDGYEVYVTSRSKRESNHPMIHYIQVDGKNMEMLLSIIKGKHFDACIDFMMYSTNQLMKCYQNLMSISDQHFFLSSYRALADSSNKLYDDSLRKIDLIDIKPQLARDRYGTMKGRQENLFINSEQGNYTIVRPPMSFSDGRFQFFPGDQFDVFRNLRGVGTVLPREALNIFTTINYGKDIALMIAKLVGKKEAIGRSFNVATSENHTWHEVAAIYNYVLGLRVDAIIPKNDYLYLVDAEYERWGVMIDRFMNRKFDNSELLRITGLAQNDFYTLETGLLEAWSHTDKNKLRQSGQNWKLQGRFDFMTRQLIDLDGVSKKSKELYFLSLQQMSEKYQR